MGHDGSEFEDEFHHRRKRSNRYLQDRSTFGETYAGMGPVFGVHDAFATEGMGAIADRTREHLGQTDKGIVAYRKILLANIRQVTRGERALMELDAEAAAQVTGPSTMDGIGPTADWQSYWQDVDRRRRSGASWAKAETSR